MTWVAAPVPPEEVTAEYLFDLGKRHRLLPENTSLAVAHFKSLSGSCAVIKVKDSRTNDEIATTIISDIVDGESAQVDFIPVAKYYAPIDKAGNRNEDPFLEKTSAALTPVFERLMKGRNLRRLTATVPKSRSRAFKALRECGFNKEGVMRRAVKFSGREAEDLVIMGMLAKE